ncbi:hypothetical protein M1L60_39475 [Actinoplanes sp. TRM 88003]|uniref:Uncharacterized protein n=1 Tax=Paractinoplanes aksuensis TaxID=2939490 RepID=A0ABT1E0L5_9ACTN|nr:hypothetical protein [Actinoplanes aksuensis]MCO8276678.1 hypothetical protein [Actinoplanes aksuensis]
MRVNDVVRRPGSYGPDEVAERLLLEAMAAVDGSLERWQAEFDELRNRGAVVSTGARGAFRVVLPSDAVRYATASVYAEVAHRCGWLDLDRSLSEGEYQHLADTIGQWAAADRTLTDALETYGRPSVWIGGTNPSWPKTLAYTTADPAAALICIHLWNAPAETPRGADPRSVVPEPVVLAVRHRPGRFHDSFSYTPEGVRRRP